MKDLDRFKNPVLHYGFLALIYGLGAVTLVTHLLGHGAHADSAAPVAAKCTSVAAVQVVTLTDRGFSPSQVTVKRCTELVFVAADASLHDPAFGEHEHHDHSLPYEERTLKLGQTNSILLDTPGTHSFHDHEHDELTGQVTAQ